MSKMLQVIPKSITFTPVSGGTAVTVTDFAEAVTVALGETMADVASQSSTISIGKILTGQSASIRTVMNNVGLDQLSSLSGNATYTAGTDTLEYGRNFVVKYGKVEFTGYDTASGKVVKVTFAKGVANVNPELTFSKDQEVRVAVTFDAVKPDNDTDKIVKIEYTTAV